MEWILKTTRTKSKLYTCNIIEEEEKEIACQLKKKIRWQSMSNIHFKISLKQNQQQSGFKLYKWDT